MGWWVMVGYGGLWWVMVGYGGLWWVDGLVLKPGGGGKVEASGSSLACSTVTLR